MNYPEMYLDYVNNFLTVTAFADHYHIDDDLAKQIVKTKGTMQTLLADHLSQWIVKTDVFEVSDWWRDSKPLSEFDKIYYGAFWNIPQTTVGLPLDRCIVWVQFTYSDYSGSTVDNANRRYFIDDILTDERYTGIVYDVYGGHGTKGIAIDITKTVDIEIADELANIFKALADYPLIDDQLLSLVESEIEEEDWESWLSRDFHSALCKAYPTCEDTLDSLDTTDDRLFELFRTLQERANAYAEFEQATTGFYHLDRLLEKCEQSDVESLFQLPLELA